MPVPSVRCFLAIYAAYCPIISICCGGTVVLCVSSRAGATVLVEGCAGGGGGLWKEGEQLGSQGHTHIHPSIHPYIHTYIHTYTYTYVPGVDKKVTGAYAPPLIISLYTYTHICIFISDDNKLLVKA